MIRSTCTSMETSLGSFTADMNQSPRLLSSTLLPKISVVPRTKIIWEIGGTASVRSTTCMLYAGSTIMRGLVSLVKKSRGGAEVPLRRKYSNALPPWSLYDTTKEKARYPVPRSKLEAQAPDRAALGYDAAQIAM